MQSKINITEKKKTIIKKASFYYAGKMHVHVELSPTGFINGYFDSELLEGQYYLFFDDRTAKDIKAKPRRLFLFEIHDIQDYRSES